MDCCELTLSLALVDEFAGAVSWGTVPVGTTEAQVNDMMMVLEVAGEATPPPIRPRPEMAPFSIPLI